MLSAALLAGAPAALAQEDPYATRGEVAAMLAEAADDYHPGVQKTDILKGYEDGQLHEERSVTRAEALVMLERAFGNLPQPTGHNARVAIPAETFTDVPDWAKTELADVFDTGIVTGTAPWIFSPDESVTAGQMKRFIERVYALFGTNLKDDFYATVNRDTLNQLEIQPGRVISGTLYDLSDTSTENVNAIMQDIIGGSYEKGRKEQKIADFYQNAADMESRNEIGIVPLTPYLDLIDGAQTIDDLVEVQSTLVDKLYIYEFMEFSLMSDLKDSTRYMQTLSPIAINLPKETYQNGTEQQISSYLKYLKMLFVLGGETEADAEAMATACFDMEKQLSESMLDAADSNNVDKIYNVFTMQVIRYLFPNVDMDAVFANSGLQPADEIVIFDVGLTKAFAAYFQEERAVLTQQNTMPGYIGERYFSQQAKQGVEKMVRDNIAVYRQRIKNLSWMSDTTKERALKKLDTLGVKIGYPDKSDKNAVQRETRRTAFSFSK